MIIVLSTPQVLNLFFGALRLWHGGSGRIQIRAGNVLGFSTQRIDSSSNIAATSTFGAQGIVTITTLGNDPNRGLQPDPVVPSAPGLSQTCAGSRQASQFIDSRGELRRVRSIRCGVTFW